jgi:RHS repeat-associated protein
LGNVLETISDKKIQHTSDNSTVDYYLADVIGANDYYSFGMEMPGRAYTASSAANYRYGFNGQEKTDEIAGAGNHTTAEFWEYDTRIGRRWNLDPKPTVGVSQYSAFNNNPIVHSDPLGDTLGGVDERSASRELDIIQSSFPGNNATELKGLFKIGDNGVDFSAINEKDFGHAIKGLSDDEQALAYGYYSLINSTTRNTVEVITREEKYSVQAARIIYKQAVWNLNFMPKGNGSDVDVVGGGGFNQATFDDHREFNGTFSIMLINSNRPVKDYQASTVSGVVVSLFTPVGEIAAHEEIGHGLGKDKSLTSGGVDAIQMGNLYRRINVVTPFSMLWRNGTDHLPNTLIPYDRANSVPDYLRNGLFNFKLGQTLLGNVFNSNSP